MINEITHGTLLHIERMDEHGYFFRLGDAAGVRRMSGAHGTFTCAMCGLVDWKNRSDAESIMADATVFPDDEPAEPSQENLICEICFRRIKGLSVEEYERLYGCEALLGEEEARV